MNMLKDKWATKFRAWAEEHRMRLSIDDDGCPVIYPSSRKNPKDHLFDGFDEGLGLYITRDTRMKLNNLVRKLQGLGLTLRQKGDWEAIFLLSYEEATQLPVFGFKKRLPPKNGFQARL